MSVDLKCFILRLRFGSPCAFLRTLCSFLHGSDVTKTCRLVIIPTSACLFVANHLVGFHLLCTACPRITLIFLLINLSPSPLLKTNSSKQLLRVFKDVNHIVTDKRLRTTYNTTVSLQEKPHAHQNDF